MNEIVTARTETSKVFDLGGNRRCIQASIAPIHYKDNYSNHLETWKDIDVTWNGSCIEKAPYILDREDKVYTLFNKKTGKISTIELIATNIKSDEMEICTDNDRVSFRHSLSLDKVPFEASFKIKGDFNTRAFDDEGELVLESFIKEGVLTERIDVVKDFITKTSRNVVGKVKIDPTWQVSTSTDDAAYCNVASAYWRTGSTLFVAGYSSSNYRGFSSAARFLNITVPAGATILTASLTLVANPGDSNNTVNTRIRGEKTVTPLTFSTVEDFEARTWTDAFVNWDSIGAWDSGTPYTSIDFKGVVQEIIGQVGWASGKNMVIFWDDLQQRSTQADGRYRRGRSYNSSAANAPKLNITYSTAVNYTKDLTQIKSFVF